MIIGQFSYDAEQDIYTGSILSLIASPMPVALEPNDKANAREPDYRVNTAGDVQGLEIGAAWKRTTDNGKEYLSVVVDSPFFAAPINAAIFDEGDDKHVLVWNRLKPKAETVEAKVKTTKPRKAA